MIKWVVVGIVFLTLGAITTLIVSWSLTITAKVEQYKTPGLDGLMLYARQVWCEHDKTIWRAELYKDRGALTIETKPLKINADRNPWLAAVDPEDLIEVGLPRWNHLFHGTPVKPVKKTSIKSEARGWPMLALRYSLRSDGNTSKVSGAIKLRSIWTDAPCEFLPIHPIWFGAFIDSALYGSALFVMALGPFYIRILIRCKRGRCFKCGYDLRHADHKVCPECGAAND
ncbi:MAG: hypothetical protein IH984_05365 [Planctomycetes bacterium]|nr:hypothetical protein [Planctomycetota bacterium]